MNYHFSQLSYWLKSRVPLISPNKPKNYVKYFVLKYIQQNSLLPSDAQYNILDFHPPFIQVTFCYDILDTSTIEFL
jgi:hypothetical protein